MSSKLVKKGLDLVCSTKESTQDRGKDSRKRKQKSRKRRLDSSYKGLSTKKKGIDKEQEKDDFTEQNLKYFKHPAWSIKKDTYEKIVQHQAKEKKSKKEENPTTEEEEDEDLF